MKNMMIFTHLCLTLLWLPSVDSARIPRSPGYPLDMAEQSVDDMYDGCNNEASTDKIKKWYAEELTSGVYAKAWEKATTCAEEKYNIRSKEDMALTKDHMQAICVYTYNKNGVYSKFNKAVREERKNYSKSFQFHILHFFLTTAIRILNPNGHCHTTYRRTGAAFDGKINQIIRLGSFSSSSYKTDLNYGKETCFKIKTCFGGYLQNYSALNDDEKEVLIPPYEMFTIKNIIKSQSVIVGLEDCKVVYVLESAGNKSDLNCMSFKLEKLKKFFSLQNAKL